ncbi:MAG: FG-GAP repeat protein [Chthoniobacterales bacterium]|nr:FG-GAP repeat protein [Chthoniobacterales bacterium]
MAVAINGATALIGADVATVGSHTSQDKAYTFTAPFASWLEQAILTASDGTADDFFGAALALDGGTALVSTPHPTINGNPFQGAAYFYTQAP